MQEDWNIILSVLESPDSSLIGKQKVFSTSPITIGRAENNDLPISDTTISRTHAIIRITNDYSRVFITDTSTYGTAVSGKIVPKGPGSGFTVVDGDTIKIGTTVLRFELKLKMSVQSTFVGEMDRSFLDEKPEPSETPPEKSESTILPEEPEIVEKPKSSVNYIYIAVIVICMIVLGYLIFFAE